MMGNGRGSGRAARHWLAAALALVLTAGGLSACTSFLASLPFVGEPPGTPPRPENPPAFPAVHDMPPARDTKTMTEAERAQLEADLQATRDQQAARAAEKSAKDAKTATKTGKDVKKTAKKTTPLPPPQQLQ